MKRRRRWKSSALLLLVLLALAGYVAGPTVWQAVQPAHLDHPVIVEIAPGSGAQGIAATLANAGILRSRWPFLTWHFARWPRTKLKAGEYRFEGDVAIRDAYGWQNLPLEHGFC